MADENYVVTPPPNENNGKFREWVYEAIKALHSRVSAFQHQYAGHRETDRQSVRDGDDGNKDAITELKVEMARVTFWMKMQITFFTLGMSSGFGIIVWLITTGKKG